MSGAVFGGDEVGAIVFDIGRHTTKAGFAGEDAPKAVIETVIGCAEGADNTDMKVDAGRAGRPNHYVGDINICRPKPGMELRNPIGPDGLVADWDLLEELLNYTYTDALRSDASNHPVMMSECAWNTAQNREQLTELMFEKYNVPAMYLCKAPVLTAFANGRSTALVIEGGATTMSVSPVYDGFVLGAHVKRSPIAGDALTAYFREMIESKTEIVPVYKVKSKVAVGEGEAAKWTERHHEGVTHSFVDYMKNRVVQDFQASVARVSEVAYHEETLASLPTSSYEFPNGYNCPFGIERYRGSEMLFNPAKFGGAAAAAAVKPASEITAADAKVLGVGELAVQCLADCDIDVQTNLWSNIVISGGATLIGGFNDRLQNVLSALLQPNTKFKILGGTGISSERIFNPWVGGSILASLGSFQQMWISRQEYDEHGKILIDKKCP